MKKQITTWILFAMIITTALYGNHAMAAVSFPDLKGHWSEHVINTLVRQSVITGFPDGTIKPNATITRAEYACLVARITGHNSYNPNTAPSFSDISNCWARRYIEALVTADAIEHSHYGATFRPSEPITRMEMTRILVNAIGRGVQARTDNNRTAFTDDSLIRHFDRGYVNTAKKYGIVNGYPDGRFDPNKSSTRAEAFVIVSRFKTANDAVSKENNQIQTNDTGHQSIDNTPVITTPSTVTPDTNNTLKPLPAPESTSAPQQKPTIGLDMPEKTYTNNPVWLRSKMTGADNLTIKWSLTRNGNEVALSEYVEGSLTNDGGSIRFTQKGDYLLTASITDATGRVFMEKSSITVYPVPVIEFSLPKTLHTDITHDLNVETQEIDGMVVDWSLVHNGDEAELADFIEGDISNDGGTVRFTDKGDYTLTASVTDVTGRVFSTSETVTVYSVTSIIFSLSETTHTDITHDLTVETLETDGLTIDWSLARNGSNAELSDFIDGNLTNDGGSIRFSQNGDYTLTASVTDATGRIFSTSESVKVYPVIVIEFSLPETMHTDGTHDLNVVTKNADDVTIDWILSRDGEQIELSKLLTGDFADNRGVIQPSQKGIYSLSASATDLTGRKFSHSSETTVYPVAILDFDISQTQYVNEPASVTPKFAEVSYPVQWMLSKGGIAADSSDYNASGLSELGGNLIVSTTGEYIISASMTDPTGRVFAVDKGFNVVPVLNCDFNVPSNTHIGSKIAIAMDSAVNTGDKTISWSLTQRGSAKSYTGSLGNNGGSFNVDKTGAYTITATLTDALGRKFTCSRDFNIYNNPPSKPVIKLSPNKASIEPTELMNITATSSDPDGDTYSLVWENNKSYYPVGEHLIRVKAVDKWGAESVWAQVIIASNIKSQEQSTALESHAKIVHSFDIPSNARETGLLVRLYIGGKGNLYNDANISVKARNKNTGEWISFWNDLVGEGADFKVNLSNDYDKIESTFTSKYPGYFSTRYFENAAYYLY